MHWPPKGAPSSPFCGRISIKGWTRLRTLGTSCRSVETERRVVTREVAPARFALALPDQPGETLPLSVAMFRNLRRQVPVVRSPEAGTEAERWDADLEGASWLWWKPGWVATPTPAAPTEPKLIPLVTTASSFDPVELVQVYTHRWPAQENSLRDLSLEPGAGHEPRLRHAPGGEFGSRQRPRRVGTEARYSPAPGASGTGATRAS